MNDADIIKALELCVTPKSKNYICSLCPYNNKGESCKTELNRQAIDLIKRQKAEIETLEDKVKLLSETNDRAEWAAISSMEMGNMLEILYGGRGKAAEKAKSIKNKSYGTGVQLRVDAAESAVLVRKV